MKISFKYEDIKVSIELDTEEVEALGAGITAAVENPDLATQVITEISERFSVPKQESNEEEDPAEEPEQESDEDEEIKVPCRSTESLFVSEREQYRFIKTWLQKRKIRFKEESNFIGERSSIKYELTQAQLMKLQKALKDHDYDRTAII